MQIHKTIWEKKKLKLEALLEPGVYFSNHQLLNSYFVQEEDFGEEADSLRELFLQEKSFEEYFFGLGIRLHYKLLPGLEPYVFGFVSPGYTSILSERLAKGFAFSDSAGIGLLLLYGKFYTDIRAGIRHVSNANLQRPNNGHNSSTIELGLGINLY